MTCKHSVHGMCATWDPASEMNGVDGAGVCTCEDDPDPSVTCCEYEEEYK